MELFHRGQRIGSVLAPGWPDWLGSDGVRLGWVVRDRLFLLTGTRVDLVCLPDECEGASAHPEGWRLALGQGFVIVDPVRAEIAAAILDDDCDPVETRVGRDVGVLIEVPESRVLRLDTGAALTLPEGASRSRWLQPWSTGVGCVWVDAGLVYRLGESVEVIGRIAGVKQVCAGPEGALVVEGKDGAVIAGPGGFGVSVPKGDGCVFVPGGVVRVEEESWVERGFDGVERQRWEASHALIAGVGGVWGHDDDGRVGPLEGPFIEGFCGEAGEREGEELVGPGGRRWPAPNVKGVKVSAEGEDSEVRLGRKRWPVPADAGGAQGDGALVWSDEGALYALA